MRNQKDPEINLYKEMNEIQVKCISDKMLLYIKYMCSEIPKKDPYYIPHTTHNPPPEERDPLSILDKSIEVYNHYIRGEPEFTSQNPKTIAAGVVYIAAVLTGTNVTQEELARILGINALTLSKGYRKIRAYSNSVKDDIFGLTASGSGPP